MFGNLINSPFPLFGGLRNELTKTVADGEAVPSVFCEAVPTVFVLDTHRESSARESWNLQVLYCNSEMKQALLQILSTEGRSVCQNLKDLKRVAEDHLPVQMTCSTILVFPCLKKKNHGQVMGGSLFTAKVRTDYGKRCHVPVNQPLDGPAGTFHGGVRGPTVVGLNQHKRT